ncbi:MAG: hypothetical protein K8T91_25695 [Planctomycetes bacterium]|nr:hypothetical protein [Planctomycetota bacterium]
MDDLHSTLKTATAEAAPLAPPEAAELTRLENIVHSGLSSFVAVGNALAQINEQRLYRETHDTFEIYLRDRWQIGRAHGYRLIAAAETVEVLSPRGDIPPWITETHLRPLLQFDPGDRAKVWGDVIDGLPLNDDGTKSVTSRDIERRVSDKLRSSKEEPYQSVRRAMKREKRERLQERQAEWTAPAAVEVDVQDDAEPDDDDFGIVAPVEYEPGIVTAEAEPDDDPTSDCTDDNFSFDESLGRIRTSIEAIQKTWPKDQRLSLANILRNFAEQIEKHGELLQ